MKHARLFGIIKTVNLPNICFMADKQTVAGVQGGEDPPPSTSTATPTQRMYDKIHTAASVADVSTTSYTHTQTKICTPVITAQFQYSYLFSFEFTV